MKKILITIVCFLFISSLSAQEAIQVYPSHWWVGMKNPNLQLMIRGNDIASTIPQFKLPAAGVELAQGVTLKRVSRVANPNYIFLDLVVTKNAKPGVKEFKLLMPGSSSVIRYELKPRSKENGKTRIKGVTSEDFIYLIMPDRFSNGDPTNDIIPGMRDQSLNRDTIFERHGGDLKGVQNKLGYLQDLGVTAVWLNPVIEKWKQP